MKSRQIMSTKLSLLMNLKMLQGLLYIQAIQKKLQINKEMLILELEQGNEVLIPKVLS